MIDKSKDRVVSQVKNLQLGKRRQGEASQDAAPHLCGDSDNICHFQTNSRDAKSGRCGRYICAIFFQLVLIFGPFWVIFGPFWQFWDIFGPIWTILGYFWAFLGNFRSFLGHFLVLIFCGKICLCAI